MGSDREDLLESQQNRCESWLCEALAERLEGGQLRAATPKDALDRLRSRWLDVFEERIL